MSKEDLIYTLLRSEKNILEDNYMKYINNNTDNELHARINNARVMASKLGNILTKKKDILSEQSCTNCKIRKYLQKHKEKEHMSILLN